MTTLCRALATKYGNATEPTEYCLVKYRNPVHFLLGAGIGRTRFRLRLASLKSPLSLMPSDVVRAPYLVRPTKFTISLVMSRLRRERKQSTSPFNGVHADDLEKL